MIKRYDGGFKERVALEAIKVGQAIAEIEAM
jgi:hypothetical protein